MLGVGLIAAVWWVASAQPPGIAAGGGLCGVQAPDPGAVPALLMPALIVAYAAFRDRHATEVACWPRLCARLGAARYRDLTLSDPVGRILETGLITGAVLLVIMGSSSSGGC